jgi:solute carrier family 6 GABA transporter-like protein 1
VAEGIDIDNDVDNDDDDDDVAAKATKRELRKMKSSGGSELHDNNNIMSPPSSTPLEGKSSSSSSTCHRLLTKLRDNSAHLPVRKYEAVGRPNAADVDIAHPWIMAVYPPRKLTNSAPLLVSSNIVVDGGSGDKSSEKDEFLTIENYNHAVETIQQFIDALVESGRAGDTRLGVHFFREWVAAVVGEQDDTTGTTTTTSTNAEVIPTSSSRGATPSSKKRQKTISSSATITGVDNSTLPLGSLSLHNYSAGSIRTFRSMENANVGQCLGTLDITGVHGLNDAILSNIICGGSFNRLRRLSLKNCRKLTGKGIASLVKLSNLRAIDVGGCFNVQPDDIIAMIQSHPSTRRGGFEEIYASGLGWTDVALESIVDATVGQLRGLGVGFSQYISGPGLILTLSKLASTLDHLAVPFCPGLDDTVLSALSKKLPKLAVLDIRGNNKVYSLSGMMEGRATSASAKHLFVLARYSGISINSLDETLRLIDSQSLTCILDGGGTGGGIRR